METVEAAGGAAPPSLPPAPAPPHPGGHDVSSASAAQSPPSAASSRSLSSPSSSSSASSTPSSSPSTSSSTLASSSTAETARRQEEQRQQQQLAVSAASSSSSSSSGSVLSASGSAAAHRVRHDKHRRNASEVRRRSEMRAAFHALKAASGCPHSGRFNVLTHAEAAIRRLQQQLSDFRQQHSLDDVDDAPPPTAAAAATALSASPFAPSALSVCAFLPVPSCVSRLSGAVLTANPTFLHLIGAASLPSPSSGALSVYSLIPHSALQLQTAVAAFVAEQPPSSSLSQAQPQHLHMKEETGSAEQELLRLLRRGAPPAAAAPAVPSFEPGRLLLSEAAVVLSMTGEARQAHLAVIGCHDSKQAEPLLLLLLSPPSPATAAAGPARATAPASTAASWPGILSGSHQSASQRSVGDRDALYEQGGLQPVAASYAPAASSSFSSFSSFAQYQRPPSPPPLSSSSMSSILGHLMSSSFASPHMPLLLPPQTEQPQHSEQQLMQHDPYGRAAGLHSAALSGLSLSSGVLPSAFGVSPSSSSSAAATAIGSSASAQYYELAEQSPTPALAVSLPLALSHAQQQQQQQQLAQLRMQQQQHQHQQQQAQQRTQRR